MRFFILVSLLVAVVVAIFYFILLPKFLDPGKQNTSSGTQTDKENEITNSPSVNKTEKQAYKDTESNKLEDLEYYINNFPNSEHIEEIYYKKAMIGTVVDCDVYTYKFSKGLYIDEVLKRKHSLMNEKEYIDPTCEELGIREPGPVVLEFEDKYPQKWTNPKDDSEMLLVRAGTFIRGSNSYRNRKVEQPEMKIYVASFYVDKYAVSHEQFQKFIDDGGYSTVEYWSEQGWIFKTKWNLTQPAYWDEYEDITNPVVGVSWFEAEAYCRWAGKMLLSEVQWEKAARGYFGQKYPWGDKWNPIACNWKDYKTGDLVGIDGFKGIAPVTYYSDYASPFGAVQMSGNCYEWVLDYWSPSYFIDQVVNDTKLRKNPINIEKNKYRVLKGGSYSLDKEHCEPAWRHGDYPSRRSSIYGFRCAKNAENVYKEYLRSLKPSDSPEEESD